MKNPQIEIDALYDIAEIRSGYTFRKRVTNNEAGDGFAIQLRDIIDHTSISNQPHRIEIPDGRHVLQKGDILFIAKGQNNFAIVFDKEYPAVASAVFFIISVDPYQGVSPEYLAWYINQAPAQRHFKMNLEGTAQRNITRKTLEQLKITIPSQKQQELICKIDRLKQREKFLEKEISEKRKLLIEQTLLNSITI